MDDAEPLASLFDTLRRYAGWLDKGRPSATVRSSVAALGTAVEAGGDTSRLIQTLENDIARLPSGGVRKMLVTTAGGVRRLLDDHSPTGFVTPKDAGAKLAARSSQLPAPGFQLPSAVKPGGDR
jgi:hypothetical protein